MQFLDAQWIDYANGAYAHLPLDPATTCRIGLTLTDAPQDVPSWVGMDVDLVSGRLRFARRGPEENEGNPRLTLSWKAAAQLVLGSGLQRVRVFDSGDVHAEGYFSQLFIVDRVLQQDTGDILSSLRKRTAALPTDLGSPCWNGVDTTIPPEDEQVLAAAVDALPTAMRELSAEVGNSTPGAQLYVSHDGTPVASVGLGECRPGVPFRRDSPTLWYCCAKPLGAVAVGKLWEQGRLDPYAPISTYLPEFTGEGRERLTLFDVLTHTSPVPTGMDPLHGGLTAPEDVRRRLVSAMRIPAVSPSGRRINYSQWWGWFLLADVIRAVDGRDYARYVAEEILAPCGIVNTAMRLTSDEYAKLAERLPVIYIAGRGRAPHPTYWFSSEAGTTECIPGVNTRGPMSDLGRFFEMLLDGGKAPFGRIVRPTTVAALTARHRTGMDDGFGNADWGLGFRLECRHISEDTTSFSSYSSPRAYGHDGLWTAVVFADPAVRLVVALHLNGKVEHDRHRERMRRICDAIYRDLRLDK